MSTSRSGSSAIAEPELEYSVDLGVIVDFELSCSTLGMREIGACATGFQEMFCTCISQMVIDAGYGDQIATISDDLLLSLEVTGISKGSLKGRFKIKLPASLRKFAKDHRKKVLAGVFAAICASTPSYLSNGASIEITSSGIGAEIKSSPPCDLGNKAAGVIENLAKTNHIITYTAASSGCKIKIEAKKK